MAIDKVLLRAIRLDASIGTLDWERHVRQPLQIDVDADVDTAALLRSEDLATGVDFAAVIRIVRRVALAEHVDLVEVLADRLARALLAETPALRVRIQVRKYSSCAQAADYAAVEVVRTREKWEPERCES